ncbi:MAG TPA: hypothetical protein VJ201_00650, partial [Candidatus Babeliales bacterium]|nr:hypothetical protein [Candidatus Babeliales bacterium]
KQKIFSNTLNNNLMHNYNMTNLPATIKAYIIQQAIDAGTLGDGNQKLNDIIVGIKSKRIDVEKICKNFETKKMIFSEYIDRLLQDYGQRNTLTKEEKSQFVEEAAIQDKLIVGRKRIKELITERLDPLEEL